MMAGLFLSFLLPSYRPLPRTGLTGNGAAWTGIRRLLGRRDLLAPYATVFAQYFSLGGVVTLLPLYIKNQGMGAFQTGMAMAAFSVMFIVTQVPVGKKGTRIGRMSLAVPGIILGIAALLCLPAVSSFSLIALCLGVYGIAHGLMFPSISTMVAEGTSLEERGMGTGIFHALLTGGVAVGAPVMGWFGGMVGLDWGLAASATMLAVALVMVLATTGVQRQR